MDYIDENVGRHCIEIYDAFFFLRFYGNFIFYKNAANRIDKKIPVSYNINKQYANRKIKLINNKKYIGKVHRK